MTLQILDSLLPRDNPEKFYVVLLLTSLFTIVSLLIRDQSNVDFHTKQAFEVDPHLRMQNTPLSPGLTSVQNITCMGLCRW